MAQRGITEEVDIIILVVYFVAVLTVGLLSMRRPDRQSLKGYFLAGRSMTWFPIGASIFASNIGSEHFIGLAGSAAASGIVTIAFEWSAAFILPFMGWIFLPVYLSSGVSTVPEYLSKRFGGSRIRVYLSIVFLCSCVISRISVDLYAGSIFIQQALGWNVYLSILCMLSITAVYTVLGGLAAVIFTDTLQTVIMVIGSIILAIYAFIEVGGVFQLMAKYMDAIPDSIRYGPGYQNMTNMTVYNSYNVTGTCGYPRKDAWNIFRDPVKGDLPWPGLMIRAFIIAIWFWCGDQVIIQRGIAAKDIGHAKGATIFASYLKFIPMFVITMPGMISRVLYPNEVACFGRDDCNAICGNPSGCSNIAYPRLVLGLAPIGLKGLLISVMVSSMMSSLTSIFNSAATVFTIDIYPRVRRAPSEKEKLIIGKLFVIFLVIISVCWIPLVTQYQDGQLFIYVTSMNGYLAPPLCSLLLLAVLVPRTSEKGVFFGMVISHCVGLVRMVLDFVYSAPKCGEPDTRPAIVSKVHPMYFASGHLLFSVLVMGIITLVTEKPSIKQIKGLTVWTLPKKKETDDEDSYLQTKFNKAADTIDITEDIVTMVVPDKTMITSKLQHSNDKDPLHFSTQDTEKDVVENGTSRVEDGNKISDTTWQKLDISTRVQHILNINAIMLFCIFVIFFILFA